MVNLMQRGAAWLGDRLKDSAGSVVSVKQADVVVVAEITATRSSVPYEVADDSGFLQEVLMHDWAVVAADLGDVTLRDGTRIVDSEGVEYEVLPVGKRPAVEPLDTSGILLRVHTKKVT
jgi:hypothetical protein